MKVAITGSSGFIGKHITDELTARGHELRLVTRQMLYGDPTELVDFIKNTDVVINLAGAPILQRWTTTNKVIIYNSRVITTKNLCAAINQLPPKERPKTYIGASAVGIYQALATHDETSSNFAINFAGRVVMDWEDASLQLDKSVRRVIFRTGMVIGKDSQIMKYLLPIYKAGLGGWIGNGLQAFAFIHIEDVKKAFCDAVEEKAYSGIFNLVAPQLITNKDFSKSLANALNRPLFFSVPTKALELVYGEAAEMIVTSPKVIPKQLQDMGFSYQFPEIDSAIRQIIA
ncbi:TIGR01777 family oxidoreductase [Sunxiuqinia sp. A32]|uniref:TIGR01777 family oxidoreductase n=1 Tax=Sunxiuqinia sp. A32 TaxID=3461496 RepID=UPI004045DBCB